ncbi:hypothetical protein ACP70R_004044 [Stipagrostis hirtigluma subsp. patula]
MMDVAAAKNEGEKLPAALDSAAMVAMGAVSLLFVGLTAWLLQPSGAGDEKEFSDVVWTLSPPICAYLLFWTAALSEAARDVAAVLVRLSFLLLLANAGTATAGPLAGSAAMFLATVYSAAASGHALAVRRQLAGTDFSAAAAAQSAARYRSRAEEDHERTCRKVLVSAIVVMAALVFLVALLPPEPESEFKLGFLVFVAGTCLVVVRLTLLRGGPFEDGDPDAMVFLAMALIVVCWAVAAACVVVFLGGVALAVYLWVAAMGAAGYLGYGVAVDARYQQLVAINRRQPRRAQDVGGLLVGRDEEDACSAHI